MHRKCAGRWRRSLRKEVNENSTVLPFEGVPRVILNWSRSKERVQQFSIQCFEKRGRLELVRGSDVRKRAFFAGLSRKYPW